MLLLSYPIRIHTWGGFGSQMYGLAVAKELTRSSRRKVNLVLHTGGVTERKAEIFSRDKRIKISKKLDYLSSNSNLSAAEPTWNFRRFFKSILMSLRIVLDDSNLETIRSIKPWTVSLRGHYTKLSFKQDTLAELAKEILLQTDQNLSVQKIDILIHYRLGDLLTLGSKSPIEAKIFNFLANIPGKIYVVSDSPEVASSKLTEALNRSVSPLSSSGGLDVVRYALTSTFFIGSSSKVSDWAILFRLLLCNSSETYAPVSRKLNLEILCKPIGSERINFYLDTAVGEEQN